MLSYWMILTDPLNSLVDSFKELSVYDYIFFITAIAFNLIIAGIFIASKLQLPKVRKTLGIVYLCLFFPFLLVFINYIIEGKKLGILISFVFIFFYMFIEFLLDYVIKYNFREKPITHVPYIILEYAALFSLIHIATDINQIWGWVVGVAFWILMASLIYLYWDKITKKK